MATAKGENYGDKGDEDEDSKAEELEVLWKVEDYYI